MTDLIANSLSTGAPTVGVPELTLTGTIALTASSLTVSPPFFSQPSIAIPPTDYKFTEDFTGTDNTNLENLTGWETDGAIADAVFISGGALANRSSDDIGSAYKSTDLGYYNHYVQYEVTNITDENGSFVCCRLSDSTHFIGIRNNHTRAEIFFRNSDNEDFDITDVLYYDDDNILVVGDVIKLEVLDDTWAYYLNGTFIAGAALSIPLPRSTRQGVVGRATAIGPWIDNYEAGITASIASSNITEDDDVVVSEATQQNTSSVSITEDDDTLIATGKTNNESVGILIEDDDTIVSTANLKLGASFVVTEDDDTLSSLTVRQYNASVSVTEDDDVLNGHVLRRPYRRTTGTASLPYTKDY